MSPTVAPVRIAALTSLLFLGAIFGFFYAWVCSTMWGLDAADPRVAISAMQAMNASVRNAVFFPAFFLTPWFCLPPPRWRGRSAAPPRPTDSLLPACCTPWAESCSPAS